MAWLLGTRFPCKVFRNAWTSNYLPKSEMGTAARYIRMLQGRSQSFEGGGRIIRLRDTILKSELYY